MLNKKKGRKEGWGGEERKKGRKKRGEREGGGWEGGKKKERKGRKRTKEKEGRERKKKSVCINCSKDEITGNVRHSLVCSLYLYFTIMSTAK